MPSYVNRHGRLTESQKRHIALLKDFDFAKFKSLEVSLSKSKLVLDIGFGNGDYTINYALNYPEKTIIASEVYLSGIGSLIRKIKKESLQNIFIFDGDAREIFENLSDSSVDEINILFPDPWQKARHNKRRLFSEDFLDLIYKKLNKSGKILSNNKLKEILYKNKELRKKNIIVLCGSGVTACNIIFALHKIQHQRSIFLYDGSWSEWGIK